MTMHQEEADSRAAWDAIAPGYDRTNTPTQMAIAGEGLGRAGLREGMRFLDVASGSGALAIPAARLGARVVAVDQSPIMLELLRARAQREKLDIETRVMDGHALTFGDGSFDLAGSQFGVMVFADRPKALREMARVVKPGGRVSIHAYGEPRKIEFLSFFVEAIRSVRPDFEGPASGPLPSDLELSDPTRLLGELTAAGLKDAHVETIVETTEFETGKELWEWILWSNPIAECILGSLDVTRDERGMIERTIDRLVRERAAGKRRAMLTNPVHIGVATR